MFGLGGAPILNPLLLEMDLIPEVSSSTTSFMVFISQIALLIDYGSGGQLTLDYAIFLSSITVTASACGVLGIRKLVRKVNRPSYLVFVISGLVLIGTLANLFKGIINILTWLEDDVSIMAMDDFC